MCKCELCEKEFKDLGYLQYHLRCVHKMDIKEIEEYYIKYFKKEGEGIDPITGGNTDFIGMKRGYKRFEKNNPKKLATNTIEHYMLNGMSFDEAKERVAHTNKISSDTMKLDWEKRKKEDRTRGGWSKKHFIELGFSDKDAEIEVKKRAENREKKMKIHRENAKKTGEYKKYTSTCLEYYLNKGMSIDDAKESLKKRQTTNTVETYIKKYGEIDGIVKFNERNKKWSDEMEKKYHNCEYTRDSNKNGNGLCNKTSSFSEKELSLILYERLKEKISDFKYYSASTGNKRQYHIFGSGRHYFYDISFKYGESKKIIEFNGDFWHMNPKKYKKDDINKYLGITAEKIWKDFDDKMNLAESNGFKTLVVWESEWNENKELIIEKCLKFLLDE